MKTWKLVSGILSIVFFALVALQSCAVGVVNTLGDSGEKSGTAGILVAFFMLTGGIIAIATRTSEKRGGNIAQIVLFGLAAILGFSSYGSYSDLAIWSGWCLINAILAVIAMVQSNKHS